MEFLLILAIAIVGFVVWNVFSFIRYKKKESKDKIKVSRYLASGLGLLETIETVFSELNATLPKRLNANTVSTVANRIASLQNMMDVENVIEIYATFIHRYICRDSPHPHPNVTDDNVLYAVHNMAFDQRNGYFVLKPDGHDEIDKKYPKPTP